jgi:hypothetical protein
MKAEGKVRADIISSLYMGSTAAEIIKLTSQ